jgi:hypothetical protein
MLDVIRKLLILQDRDRQLLRLKEELAHIPIEREQLQKKAAATQQSLDGLKNKARHTESERKRLELEVEAKKQLIERYSLQQFQTRKNEEYRALAHEIEMCKDAIRLLEDQQLELMEQAEILAKELAEANKVTAELKRNTDSLLANLATREQSMQKEMTGLEANRSELASAVEEPTRIRYERLFKQRGNRVVVGVDRGVCGGCHMQLSRQTIVSCRAEQEITTCVNCGRILYFTPEMDLAVAE